MKYFNISEFTSEKEITPRVADLIITHHIEIMIPIRRKLGIPIYVSEGSGYRSYETEIKAKRSGDSEHCFRGKGAADYTCENLEALGRLLVKESLYNRICFYPDKKFFHCDYKEDLLHRVFINTPDGWIHCNKWVFKNDKNYHGKEKS